jgi:hypothetical protein
MITTRELVRLLSRSSSTVAKECYMAMQVEDFCWRTLGGGTLTAQHYAEVYRARMGLVSNATVELPMPLGLGHLVECLDAQPADHRMLPIKIRIGPVQYLLFCAATEGKIVGGIRYHHKWPWNSSMSKEDLDGYECHPAINDECID